VGHRCVNRSAQSTRQPRAPASQQNTRPEPGARNLRQALVESDLDITQANLDLDLEDSVPVRP
jgi:hypothetical protein